jgi:hypothetical protein
MNCNRRGGRRDENNFIVRRKWSKWDEQKYSGDKHRKQLETKEKNMKIRNEKQATEIQLANIRCVMSMDRSSWDCNGRIFHCVICSCYTDMLNIHHTYSCNNNEWGEISLWSFLKFWTYSCMIVSSAVDNYSTGPEIHRCYEAWRFILVLIKARYRTLSLSFSRAYKLPISLHTFL